MPGLLVVVPALNEEHTVAAVVRSVHEVLGADVLVVDDGSTDRTASVAQGAGAYVLSHPFNLGVGAAVRSGLRFAAEQGYSRVAQVDADGQHEPTAVARLLARLDEDGADLVVGSRFEAGYQVGRTRRLAMRWLSRRVSHHLGVRVTDTSSGFRVFGKRAVERFACSYPTAYLSDTVEALLMAGDLGFVVAEEPVQMHARQGGEPSAKAIKSAYHTIRLVMVILLHRVRTPLSSRSTDDVET